MKKLCLVILILTLSFSVSGVSFAAVSFDAAARANAGSPGTSRSWTHVNGGSATAIIVEGGSPNITTVTYDSITLTEIQDMLANDRWVQHYLVSPSTGSNTVTVNSSNSDNYLGGSISVTGSDTTADVIGATATSTCSSCTSISKAITTTRANSLNIDVIICNGGASNCTSESATGNNQTQRFDDQTFSDGKAMGSTQVATSTGSYTMSWSWSNVANAGIFGIVEVREVVAAAEVYQETEWWFSNTF